MTLVKKLMMKILNLKLVILLEYQNIKTFLQKVMFQIGLKKILWLEKLKALSHGQMLLVIWKVKKLLERFPESKSSGGRVKLELDLSNYATRADLINVDISKFAKSWFT